MLYLRKEVQLQTKSYKPLPWDFISKRERNNSYIASTQSPFLMAFCIPEIIFGVPLLQSYISFWLEWALMHQSSNKTKIWFFPDTFFMICQALLKTLGMLHVTRWSVTSKIFGAFKLNLSVLCSALSSELHICAHCHSEQLAGLGEMEGPRLPNWSFLHREGFPSLSHHFISPSFSCGSKSICIHPHGGVRKWKALVDSCAVPLGPFSVQVCFIEVLHHEASCCCLLQVDFLDS